MKQLVASYRTGRCEIASVPPPAPRAGGLLVRTRASLVSAGTERAVLDLARSGFLAKARARPDLVRKLLDKARRDGWLSAARSALAKLDEPLALGYSCAGEVAAVEPGPTPGPLRSGPEPGRRDLAVGDRVACGGAGRACHAEYVFVPYNLCARVPDGVGWVPASFVAVGSIALHAFRLSRATLGESVAVIGAGLVGQLALEIARAAGCATAAVDLSESRLALASELGAEATANPRAGDAAAALLSDSPGGYDAVLVCAATESDSPLRLASALARDRARVVAVGQTGLEVPRREFYRKELELVVSRSYGPGRYDREYEEEGRDYPAGLVRWTEGRNFEAFLRLVAEGKVRPSHLVSHRFEIDRALEAYELLTRPAGHGDGRVLGVVIEYPERKDEESEARSRRVELPGPRGLLRRGASTHGAPARGATLGASFIGAGAFARSVLIPAVARERRFRLRGIASLSGLTARDAGRRGEFQFCTSDVDDLLSDEETDVVFIATRHASHAELAARALTSGKAVFVEKPLAIDRGGLELVTAAARDTGLPLMVGFNRRFSPLARELRSAFEGFAGPLVMNYTVNAGPLPAGHWSADPGEGGRLLGEVGHFIDLTSWLAGEPVTSVSAVSCGEGEAQALFSFAETGSTASLTYTGLGDAGHLKERLEVFGGGRVAVLTDFRRLETVREGRRKRRTRRQDKGHRAEMAALAEALELGAPDAPFPFEELRQTTLASLAVAESVTEGRAIPVGGA